MSALSLQIPDQPIEKVVADVVVVACLADERPLRGAAARADWRLCGAISAMLLRDEIGGDAGEAALFPSSGGVRADRVLVLGVGPGSRRPAERLRAYASDALSRLIGLQAGRAAIALLPQDAGDVRDQLEQLVSGLAEALGGVETGAELCVGLVPPPAALAEAREAMAQLATQHWSAGLRFEPG